MNFELQIIVMYHSAKDESVSCNFKEKSLISAGNLPIILWAKSITMFRL
jgi:hypothetical protein